MIARVFPRRNHATPTDALTFTCAPDLTHFMLGITAVEVSVSFSWDLPIAERLARAWSAVAPTTIGGPATGMRGEAFVPGCYLREGYVITSRGCPNRCPHCEVWRREGATVRELPIHDGYNVLDDNLLACSDAHVTAVFTMLARQRQRVLFSGGLEAARLRPWHVDWLVRLHPLSIFFAYDDAGDYAPLMDAGQMLYEAGFSWKSRMLRCYVLCGYPGDTLLAAERRMLETVTAGFWPMAMCYRDATGIRDKEWIRFAKCWSRPGTIHSMLRDGTRASGVRFD